MEKKFSSIMIVLIHQSFPMVLSKTKKNKRVSYWCVEGVNALILVYLVTLSRDIDRVQVFRQRYQLHGEKNNAGVMFANFFFLREDFNTKIRADSGINRHR